MTRDKWQVLRLLLNGYKQERDYSFAELAAKIIPTEKQGRQRIGRMFRNPETMTVGELLMIGRTLGIPIEELRAAIPGR